MAITVEMRTQVAQLYVALFGRAPEGEGLGFWVQKLNEGWSFADVANTMYATEPARAYYPNFLTNAEIVRSFYVNVLGREPDTEGLAFWTAKLNEPGASPGSVIAEMIDVVANYTGDHPDGLTSQALFNNRVEVAQYYGEQNGTLAGASAVLLGVTADDSTVDAAKQAIDEGTIPGVNQGQTFTLTANKDTVIGTNGNDTIDAVPGQTALGASATTLQAFDSIDGGAGQDTLNIYSGIALNVGTPLPYNVQQVGTVKNVEIVNIYNDAGLAGGMYFGEDVGGIDAAKFQGVQQIWQNGAATNVANVGANTTLGFRDVMYVGNGGEDDDLQIGVKDDVASVTLALDQTDGEDLGFEINGDDLTTLNITGQVSFSDGEEGHIHVEVVDGAGTKLTVNTAVNTYLSVADTNFVEIDAAASTGDLYVGEDSNLQTVTTGSGDDFVRGSFVTTATKAASYTTGAGEDGVSVQTSGTGSTTVDTGDGEDWIDLVSGSKSVSVAAGAGADMLWVGEDVDTSVTTALNVDMGAGDDEVEFEDMVMADLPAAWVVDGGEGNDTVTIGAGAARTFVAGDYVTLTESLKNFENLNLEASASEYTVDASRIGDYGTVTLIGEGNTLNITKVSAEQTIGVAGNGSTLNVTAAGYKAATETTAVAFGGDLKVAVGRFTDTTDAVAVDANGANLTLTVDASLGEDNEYFGEDVVLEQTVTLTGDIQTANVTLNSVALNNGEDGADFEETGVSLAALELATVSGEDADLANLTSVTVSGKGTATIDNGAGSKLVSVDASGLTGFSWNATTDATGNGLGLDYSSSNASAETVKLSGGLDLVELNASTVSKMDSIQGLTLVATSAGALDVAKSDDITVTGATGAFAELTASQAASVSALGSLNLALQQVAQYTSDAVVFHYGGNTYVYSDTVADVPNQLDDGDLLVQLTGTIDLDLLVTALNDVA